MPFITQGKANLKYILIVVILAAIAGGGILGYQYWWVPKHETQKPVACTLEAKVCPDGSAVGRTGPNCEFAPCPTVNPEETADWKIYENKEYGYMVSYPKDWYVYDGDAENIYFQSKKEEEVNNEPFGPHTFAIRISVFDNPSNLTAKEWGIKELHQGMTVKSEKEAIVGNIKGIQITPSCEEMNCEYPMIYISKGSKIYRFDEQLSGESEVFGKMLSTFKFTDETANWKTYKNEKYGFEFDYPQDWLFNEKSTGGVSDSLDIHLSNIQPSDSFDCKVDYIGLEIQVGLTKNSTQNFISFVKSQLVESGLGPKGLIEEIIIGGHHGFKVGDSGWDTACRGPGYFIEQDSSHYIYVFSGVYGKKQEGLEKINQILSTFKFPE